MLNPILRSQVRRLQRWRAVKIEFTAVGDAVSLTSALDNGKSTEQLLAAGTPVVFEPKESIKLRYSKSRAQFAQLKLNGKQIVLPASRQILRRRPLR